MRRKEKEREGWGMRGEKKEKCVESVNVCVNECVSDAARVRCGQCCLRGTRGFWV